MSAFINENFMLSNETARQLFHGEAEKLPIIDYHCHLSPREIAENIRFRDITQLWLVDGHSGDGNLVGWRPLQMARDEGEWSAGGIYHRRQVLLGEVREMGGDNALPDA